MAKADLNLDAFKQAFQGGVRTNLFNVVINKIGGDKSILCKSAALPETSVDPIDVQWRGRTLHVPGDRKFAEWTATFYLDTALDIHAKMVAWHNEYNDMATNTGSIGLNAFYNTKQITGNMIDRTGADIPNSKFKLTNPWPSKVGSVALDVASTEMGTFEVVFYYDYCTYGA